MDHVRRSLQSIFQEQSMMCVHVIILEHHYYQETTYTGCPNLVCFVGTIMNCENAVQILWEQDISFVCVLWGNKL